MVELMLFPLIVQFAEVHNFSVVLAQHQNHYPDISLVATDGTKIALDLKSTYRTSPMAVNGFTLGAFTGYFRHRQSAKNITFPYAEYSAHFVLGVIYTRTVEDVATQKVYTLADFDSIQSVATDFTIVLQEKWRIAGERPGSDNTKNIGSILSIEALLNGTGPFSTYGQPVFDDYWMNYLTADMARAIDSPVPYQHLAGYQLWRNRPPNTIDGNARV